MPSVTTNRIQQSIKVDNSSITRIYQINFNDFPELPEFIPSQSEPAWKNEFSRKNHESFNSFLQQIFNGTYTIGVTETNGVSYGTEVNIPFVYEYYQLVSVYADLGVTGPLYENYYLNLMINTSDLTVSRVTFTLGSQFTRNGTQTVFAGILEG